ncbi:hypothetical protein JCM5350_006547 [Sporobolomyces pararoseus]
MSSLLIGSLDFPLSSLSSLSTTQLALAKLHPDFEESDALKICQLFFHRREKARRAQQEGGGSRLDQDEDAKFALVGLDFRLDGKLEELNEEQLAAVVVLAHPDATELHVLKAERIWRKRREKLAQSKRTQSGREGNKAVEQPRVQPEPVRVPIERAPEPPKVDNPPPPPAPTPSQPPQAQAVLVPTAPRPRKVSRPLPPLPPVESRLPDTLCQEIFALKLSNLPVVEIKTRDDVSSLFPRNLLPDAVILHRPLDPDDVSRTAYVGWIFDFEKRTEAMQEVIRVRMGRWRAIAEFTDSEKPRWEWGDLVKVKRQFAWKVWNEREQEREEKRLEEEAEKKRKAEEDAMIVEQGSKKEEETRSSLAQAEPEKIQPVSVATEQGSAAAPLDLPPTDGEPEAIVLDSPALPPIPSRAPSRDGSSQNDATHSFQPPPMRPLSPGNTRTPTAPRAPLPAPREIRAPRSRPTSPRASARSEIRTGPSPTHQRDAPPHIVNPSRPPLGPSSSSSSYSPLHLPPRPVVQPSSRQQPQYVDSAREVPPRLPVSGSSSSASLEQPQDPKPAPPPSLLARTTELEVRGSAPTPSAASQAKKPSLMDRLNGNNGSSPSTSERGSPPVGSGRGQSPVQQVNRQTVSSNSSSGGGGRMSPGAGGRGGNSNSNNGKAKGNQGNSQLSNQNNSNQNNSNQNSTRQQGQNHHHQQQQQQHQHQQSKGKKRAANNDPDSHQDQRGNQRGGNGSSSNSILDRIEGTGNNNSNGNGGGGGGRGPAKKAKNNSTGGNSRDQDQGGGSSLLSRLG